MAQHVFCSIFDKATQAYMRPFQAPTVGAAMRSFEDDVRNPESPANAHPEDYALFQIATFDDQSGLMQPIEPICLRRAHEINQGNQ